MSSNTFEMCRCCGIFELPKPQKLIPFFGPGKHENLIVNIKNVITSCWEVQIAENDGHPQHICPKCFSTFDAYFSLRGFCRRNQNHLNDVFRKKTTDQIAKCRVYEETDENNREINTEEDTANKSLTCNKNKQAKTGTKFLNAPENQNDDTEVQETKWKCIEFVDMPITIFKKQRQIKDGVVHCKRNGHDDQKLNNQLIEEPEYEGDVQYLENSDELNNQEILEQLNCNKETDHGNYTTLIKQVFQIETDCEIVVESEISQPEFNQFDDIDSLEYENTVSTDDKDYEENIIYQSETDKNRQNENPLECKYCRFDTDLTPNGIEFKSKEKLDAHIKVQHVSPRPYTCIICKKNFVSLYNCKQHIKFVHKKKKTICWICGLHFGHLKQHVERCHTVADFECETCGKKFKNVSPNIFRYHKRWHSKTYRYKCTYCGKIFIQSTHLRTHILTRHTRNFTIKCLKCGKVINVYKIMSSSTFEMCRCCGIFELPKPQKLIPFFGPGEHQNLIVNIKNVITSCWDIQLAENDGHPQHICPTCLSKFDAYFILRGFCRRNQNHLNAVFRKMTSDRIEKCRVYKENYDNNGEIRTEEGTTNKSLICNKNNQVETGSKCLNAPENQSNDTAVKDFKSKSLEFVPMSITISKNQREIKEDGVVHCERNGHDDQKLINQLIEEPEYEEDIEYLDELKNQEILEKPNCNKETDHENHTTHIRTKQSVLQIETDCEVVVESATSQSELSKFNDTDSLEQSTYIENENTVSTDDEDYEDNIIYQAEIDKYKKITYIKLNPLECKYCCFDTDLTPNGIEFKSMEELDAHIKLQHISPSPYICQICKKNFVSHQTCTQHIDFVHKKKKTICWICGLSFGHLRQHVQRCHTVADFECETCGKKFKNVSADIFNYHKRLHDKKYRYKCTFCGKIFIQSTHLKTHIVLHTKDFTIKCLKCGKGFSSQFCKAMHMYRIHGDALPVKCLYCDARFPQYQKRIAHMLEIHGHVHVNDEKYKCLKCNKVFRREYNLEKHMESGCEKGTWKDNKTINKGYTPAPKIKKYSCQECGRLFGKKSALLMHIPLHSKKGRPFQCNVCQLHYKTNSHLYSHKRLKHSNEKPFACDICGKKFALNYMLTEHKSFHKAKLEKAFKID